MSATFSCYTDKMLELELASANKRNKARVNSLVQFSTFVGLHDGVLIDRNELLDDIDTENAHIGAIRFEIERRKARA